MKENIYNLTVTDVERRIIIQAINILKENQIKQDKRYDFLDELIVRICNSEPDKGKLKKYVQR